MNYEDYDGDPYTSNRDFSDVRETQTSAPSRKSRSSPRKRSSAPRKRSSAPRKRSSSPRKRSSSPRKRSSSPRKRSSAPRKRSSAPRKRAPAPRKRARVSPENSPTSAYYPYDNDLIVDSERTMRAADQIERYADKKAMDILNESSAVVPSAKTRDRILDIHAMDCNTLDAELRDVKGSASNDFLESMMRRYEELGCYDKSVSETKSWYGWAWKIVEAFMSKIMGVVEKLGAWKQLVALILVVTCCPVIPVINLTNPFYPASLHSFGGGFLNKFVNYATRATKDKWEELTTREYATLSEFIEAVSHAVVSLPGDIGFNFLLKRFGTALSIVVRRLGAKDFFDFVINKLPFMSFFIGAKRVAKVGRLEDHREDPLIQTSDLVGQATRWRRRFAGTETRASKQQRKQDKLNKDISNKGVFDRAWTNVRNAVDVVSYKQEDRLKMQRARERDKKKPWNFKKRFWGGGEAYDDALENFHREFAIRRGLIKPYMHWAASVQIHGNQTHQNVSGGGGPLVSRDLMISNRSVVLFIENTPKNMIHSARYMSQHW